MSNPRITKRNRVLLKRGQAEEIRSCSELDSSQRKVVVDCSFAHVMDEMERNSLAVQIQECYSHLRSFGTGVCQLYAVSVDGTLHQNLLRRGADKWAIHLLSEPLEDVMMDCNIFIMSPDASDELTWEEVATPNVVFVIGGIVDRRVTRNETAHKAMRLGVKCRRLPLDIGRFKNKVFNVDTVFLFLLKAIRSKLQSREDMVNLLESVVPDRKKIGDTPIHVPQTTRKASVPQPEIEPIKLERYHVLELFS